MNGTLLKLAEACETGSGPEEEAALHALADALTDAAPEDRVALLRRWADAVREYALARRMTESDIFERCDRRGAIVEFPPDALAADPGLATRAYGQMRRQHVAHLCETMRLDRWYAVRLRQEERRGGPRSTVELLSAVAVTDLIVTARPA